MAPVNRRPQVASRRVLGQLPLDPQARHQWRQAQRIIFLALCAIGIWILYMAGSWMIWAIPRLIAPLIPHWSSPISSSEKARMHEVAELVLDIYNTLAEMRYIDPAGIIPGPHNLTYNQATFAALGLDPAIIYLYSILPYIDVRRAGRSFFYDGGQFIDFRNPNKVQEGRDPLARSPRGKNFYAENGPYMRPWMTPLSYVSDHYSGVLVYDARHHKIWIVDMESWGSVDPKFDGAPDAFGDSPNMNSLEHIRNRGASDVLKDINRWYRELKILPGGMDDSPKWHDEEMDLAALYRKNGWPDKFNGDGFQVDQARRRCAISAEESAREPMEELKRAESWNYYYEATVPHLERAIALAESEDEEWVARFELWKFERANQHHVVRLSELKKAAEKYCPDGICQRAEDLPLWELHCLKEKYARKRNALAELKKYAPYEKDARVVRAEKDVFISYAALKASQAEADRLRPGAELETPQDDAGNHFDELIRWARQDAHDYREFLATIPSSSEKTRALVEKEAESSGWQIADIERRKALRLEWEKEDREWEKEQEEMLKALE